MYPGGPPNMFPGEVYPGGQYNVGQGYGYPYQGTNYSGQNYPYQFQSNFGNISTLPIPGAVTQGFLTPLNNGYIGYGNQLNTIGNPRTSEFGKCSWKCVQLKLKCFSCDCVTFIAPDLSVFNTLNPKTIVIMIV